MKKDLLTHFSFFVAFFIFISIFRGWLKLDFLPFWFGGIIGSILPDIDHLIYVYLVKSHEPVSQAVDNLISNSKFKKTWDLLALKRSKRVDLIFHTAYFQLIFLIFAFLVITSSGSLLGTGIVVAFSLHLLIDQLIDLTETKNLDNWFRKVITISNEKQRNWYLVTNIVILLIFGFFL